MYEQTSPHETLEQQHSRPAESAPVRYFSSHIKNQNNALYVVRVYSTHLHTLHECFPITCLRHLE